METQENLIDLLERAADYDSEHINAKRVKFWLDGAPLPPQYLPTVPLTPPLHVTQC
jgi:hypothetical protein